MLQTSRKKTPEVPARTPRAAAGRVLLLVLLIAFVANDPSSHAANERPGVMFLTGHGERTPSSGFSRVAESLGADYSVQEVELTGEPGQLAGTALLVVAGSPDIPDDQLYQVDQYLMRGGRIFFTLDAADIPEDGLQSNISGSNIFGFLETFGISVDPNLVMDRQCAQGAHWNAIDTDAPYPFWPLVSEDDIADNGPFAGLSPIQFAFTSTVTAESPMPGDTETNVLATSSDNAWTVSAFADLNPLAIPGPKESIPYALEFARDHGFPLAVSVEGEFTSAFSGKSVIVEQGKHVKIVKPEGIIEKGAPTAVVVMGGSTMFLDSFVDGHPENAAVFKRVVDWLVRTEVTPAPATEAQREALPSGSLKSARFVILLVIVLLAVFWAATAFVMAGRRRRNR
jgi:ABC-2 type transport system permease protein